MSETIARSPVVLEPASQEFVEATSKPPFLYQLTPAEARKVLDDVQAAPIDKLPVDDRRITVPAEVGDVRVAGKPVGIGGELGGVVACPDRPRGGAARWCAPPPIPAREPGQAER